MEDLQFSSLTTVAAVFLIIFGALVTVQKGIEAFKALFLSKGNKSVDRIAEIEKKQQCDYNRMNAFDVRLDSFEERILPVEDGMKQQCVALKALLHHGVTGNATGELANAEKDLDKWLINK